jgi:ribosomal protein L11 methyltransferase
VAPDQEDLACWLMIDLGARGCEVERRSAESLLIKAYFEDAMFAAPGAIALKLEEYGLGKALVTLEHEDLEDQDWLGKWKLSFKSFSVGDRFRICPAWQADLAEEDVLEPGQLRILIEPGMAFGTGLHATTQFCLNSLEKRLPAERVLDVGTGSGILAIATALLDKAAKILAIDIDANALENAALNLKLNRLEERIELMLVSPEKVEGTFNLILSNMTCEDIIALLPTYRTLLAPNGVVVGAGILKEKMKLLENAISQSGFEIVGQEERGEWLGVHLGLRQD